MEEKAPVSTPLTIEISLIDKEIYMKCEGEVIWVNEKKSDKNERKIFDTGIKFTKISNNDKEEIRNAVTSFLSKSNKA